MAFIPRPLEHLSDAELMAYAGHCRFVIQQNGPKLEVARAVYDELSRGKRKDAILTYGGTGLAILGLATTPLLTPLGAAALVGGIFSLFGMADQHEKIIKRSHLRIDIENLLASDEFCKNELIRIVEETARRRSIGP